MKASIPHFVQSVDEIEQNSWWSKAIGPKLKPIDFTYSITNGRESITEVPKEPFESLLLPVRRLTMNRSSEQLHVVRKALEQQATHESDRHLLDVWCRYWRLAFIKEPFEMIQSGVTEIMTPFRVYDCFINGRYFHTNVPEYNVLLYGSETPVETVRTYMFLENLFHSVVVDLCLCAIALHRFVKNGYSFVDMSLNDGAATVFGFMWCRNRMEDLDEQYRIFNDWIQGRGGCKNCRWT
jgi:hypothetical protein